MTKPENQFSFFTPLEGAQVLLYNRGNYSSLNLYLKGKQLYAKRGSSYIRLLPNNSTSLKGYSWISIEIPDGSHAVVGCELHWTPRLITQAAE